MEIRQFKDTDAHELRQLFYDTVHSVNAQDYTPEQLAVWAAREYDKTAWQESFIHKLCFVVEVHGKIVGFGDITQDGYLDRLFVHKDFQGQGIATRIVDTLENEARANGILLLRTEASIMAKPFFEKRGFVVVKEQQKLHRGCVFINYVMEKKL